MKNMTVHDCIRMRDPKTYCAILVSEDASFFVPILLNATEGQMLLNFLVGEEFEDEELNRLLFIPESWRQLDSNMVAVELDFDDSDAIVLAHVCMHQKSEVTNKFFRVVTPMGYALIYSSHYRLPLYVDDRISGQDGREIQRLEGYLKNI